jgi:hypothetical protein
MAQQLAKAFGGVTLIIIVMMLVAANDLEPIIKGATVGKILIVGIPLFLGWVFLILLVRGLSRLKRSWDEAEPHDRY